MEEKKHSHYGHRSRLRDRVSKEGIQNFQDYQVLEYALSFVIPYKDTNPIAHDLIGKFGSIVGVLEAREEDLKAVKGMGEVSAYFLTSLVQIFAFYQKEKNAKNVTLGNAQETAEFARNCFAGSVIEEAYLISLLPNNKVLKVEKVGEGTISNVEVSIRKITDAVSRNRVNKVILTHNHPNSDATPSEDDDQYTKALVTALALNDCLLVDHIIIGSTDEEGFYSYQRSEKIDKYMAQVEKIIRNTPFAPTLNYNLNNKDRGDDDDKE